MKPRATNPKSVFITAMVTFDVAVTVLALVQLARGAGAGWIGPLAAALPPPVFFGSGYLWRREARTSAGLPSLLVPAVAGVAWSVASPGGGGGRLLLAAGALLGTALYVAWYSRLDRSATPCLAVGLPLPDFGAREADGTPFRSASLRGRPAVLLFYRGNWCPFCVAQVGELAASYRELERRGAQVVLVSPQPAEKTRSLARRFGAPMRFVVDEGSRAARELGLLHEGGVPAGFQVFGYDSDTVLPTVIVTDAAGRIAFFDATDNYRLRPEPETFLRVLDAGTQTPVRQRPGIG